MSKPDFRVYTVIKRDGKDDDKGKPKYTKR